MSSTILALDPGTDKLGLAVLAGDGMVLHRDVVPRPLLATTVQEIVTVYKPTVVVLGDGTGAKSFQTELERRRLLPQNCNIVMVDEYRTSEEARWVYLREHRRGWRRLIPLGLQIPAEPYDDYVAVILGRRYLNKTKTR